MGAPATDRKGIDTPPIFICGALRSGTTLLRIMLDHHPEIANPGEMDFLFEFNDTGDADGDRARFHAHLATNRIFQAKGLSIDPALNCADLTRSCVGQLNRDGQILTINLHRNFEKASKIFPGSHYVHLVRDPRDVARSAIGMGWAGHVYFGVEHWIASEKSMDRLAQRVEKDTILTVRNEDLIRSPVVALGQICAFMGVNFDPAMLQYSSDSTYSAPDPALVEQWRKKLSARETGMVEGRVGDLLADRGYRPSGYPIIKPEGITLAKMRLSNRIARFRYTMRKYGAALTISDLIGRRLNIPPLRNWAQRKINQKTLQYLK